MVDGHRIQDSVTGFQQDAFTRPKSEQGLLASRDNEAVSTPHNSKPVVGLLRVCSSGLPDSDIPEVEEEEEVMVVGGRSIGNQLLSLTTGG